MTAPPASACFLRRGGVVWRDTGDHVVALSRGDERVFVLGGGNAQLWRLLEQPRRCSELADSFAADSGNAPTVNDIAMAIEVLVSCRLVRELGS